jgi:hypothetical protein
MHSRWRRCVALADERLVTDMITAATIVRDRLREALEPTT